MTKKHSTKRALIASVLMLCLCITSLVGTTFAWFTDEVTSANNIIQTGKLDVAMYWAEGDEDPTAVSDWTNGAGGAIFNNDKWEPGYVEAKHIKVANEGSLALKYQMRIIANGVVSDLADVIDVYYFADAKQLDRAAVEGGEYLGTLSDVLNVSKAGFISNKVAGSLEAGASKTITLALKMQESAGNEYQNMSIGTDFAIQILATQYTSESDSFNNQYDAGADFDSQKIPAANVSTLNATEKSKVVIAGFEEETLDAAYQFVPTETAAQGAESEYKWYHADFYVSADADVPANSMLLAGYFELYGQLASGGKWIGLTSDQTIKAGESVRLIRDGVSALLGNYVSVDYNSICSLGNDGIGFLCGATDLTGVNDGTTLSVELRLYETKCDDPGCHHNNDECETGEYITVGKFDYTFSSLVEITPDTSWYESDPEADEYTLTTAAELAGFAELVNSGKTDDANIKLGADVDLTGINWTTPIGTSSNEFEGTFDGCGYTINGLTAVSSEDVAFFGELWGATVKNVNFTNANVKADNAGIVAVFVGGSTIENVHVLSGSVNAANYGAAFAGQQAYYDATIKNCTNYADITAGFVAAGFGGYIWYDSVIENCTNYGDIIGGNRAGGIAAHVGGTVKNCENNGEIVGNGAMSAGGIVAVLSSASTFENCVNNGNVTNNGNDANNSLAGGILAVTPGSAVTIKNCVNNGDITANYCDAAGIATSHYGTLTAIECENTGDIYGATGAAGTAADVGMFGGNNTVTDCTNTGTVTEG